MSNIITEIKIKFPKLFVTETIDNDLTFGPEKTDGFVEYKRTLVDCNNTKAQKYATQMRWRITENIKSQCATYFIGIDDDGTIIGLTDEDIVNCVVRFVSIAQSISASIVGVQLIHINNFTIIKIGVKIKKIFDNFLVDFDGNSNPTYSFGDKIEFGDKF